MKAGGKMRRENVKIADVRIADIGQGKNPEDRR
jgi:hypothetical protein